MKIPCSRMYLFANGIATTPSSRLRWFNYLEPLRERGFCLEVISSGPLLKRLKEFWNMEGGGIVIVQKKLLTLGELLYLRCKMKILIFDIDDSIWLSHPTKNRGLLSKVKQLYKSGVRLQGLRLYDRIICANAVLEQALIRFKIPIDVVPTAPSDKEVVGVRKEDDIFRIVWTGTQANFFYLEEIAEQLKAFLDRGEKRELCILSDGQFSIEGLKHPERLRNVTWSVESESTWIQRSSLGIMPLTTDEWSRGKSAFKLLKYMKLGIPVLATDFGFQRSIIQNDFNGFLIGNNLWEETLTRLWGDPLTLEKVAARGRESYSQNYAPPIILDRYLSIFDF